MKKVNLKFEQVQSTKKVETLVSANTRQLEYKETDEAIKIVCEIVTAVNQSIQFAKQMKVNNFVLGGQKFFINKKFNLYVCVNGVDYSLNDCESFLSIGFDFKLSKLELFATGLFSILKASEGKNHLANNTESKKIASVVTALQLV